MGTYFALTEQITQLAEELDKKGELIKLFQQAHTSTAKREEEKAKASPTPVGKDK